MRQCIQDAGVGLDDVSNTAFVTDLAVRTLRVGEVMHGALALAGLLIGLPGQARGFHVFDGSMDAWANSPPRGFVQASA